MSKSRTRIKGKLIASSKPGKTRISRTQAKIQSTTSSVSFKDNFKNTLEHAYLTMISHDIYVRLHG